MKHRGCCILLCPLITTEGKANHCLAKVLWWGVPTRRCDLHNALQGMREHRLEPGSLARVPLLMRAQLRWHLGFSLVEDSE